MPPSEAAIPIEDHPRRRCDAKAALRVEALGRRAGLDEPARSDASRAIAPQTEAAARDSFRALGVAEIAAASLLS